MAYIGKQPTVGNFQVCDAISVVNGQAAYTLQVGGANVAPESANHMLVSLNGVLQKPGSSFTISGSTMTFASNLATGDVIDFVQILGNVLDIGQPSDDTVTAAKLNNDIISGQTALTSSPADTDELLISDAGTIKRIDYSLIKGSGKIAQVVQTVKTDVFSSSSSSYADVTGLSVNITPSATSSKVLCFSTGAYGKDTTDNFNFQLVRDSTSLLENKLDPGTNNNQTNTFSIQFLDSPSSTSQLTYKIQIKNDGTGNVNINRNNAGSTDRADSVITVMEVLA